jgi:hypothetical protein
MLLVGIQVQPANAAQRSDPHNFEVVWAASVGALQGRADPIIYGDKVSGLITTDYKAEDEDYRHKFNLLLVRNAETTTVSVTCIVEEHHGSRAFTAAGWQSAPSDGSRENRLLDAISRRLEPGGSGADTSDSNCRANFKVGGSMVRGTTYSTYAELTGLTQLQAIDQLLSVMSSQSLVVVSADKTSGEVSATQQSSPGGKTNTLDFTVTAISGGVRVAVRQKFRIGDRGRDDTVRDEICKVISAVGVAGVAPSPSSTNPGSGSADNQTIEDRLHKLDELYKKGVITEEEYKKKRAELLSKL